MFGLLSLLCLAFAAYPLAIYPIVVMAMARVRPKRWIEGTFDQPVVHVITVHDEESRIRGKLENALSLAAPPGGLETVVVDDGSTDRTEAIVREFAGRGVRWIGCLRRGKEDAQIDAVRQTTAPVLVFSDASTTIEPGALSALLAPFCDPEVAAVSGHDRLEASGAGTGEDLYVRYEMAVRRAESLVGSLVGLSGCFFAVRRGIAESLKPAVPSDLGAALLCVRAHRRAVTQEGARCRYAATAEAEKEFRRKRRTALRGLRALLEYREAISRGAPVAVWQVLSHKLMRFLIPVWLLLAAACAAAGAVLGEKPARLGIAAAAAACALAGIALALPALRRLAPLRALGFLALSNAAVLAAWVDVLSRKEFSTWSPTRRP